MILVVFRRLYIVHTDGSMMLRMSNEMIYDELSIGATGDGRVKRPGN